MRHLAKALFCVIFIIAVSLQAGASDRDRLLDIQVITSDTGVEAWLVEDHTLPIIAMEFSFKGAGAALDPPEKQGLSLMASNTMDEGAGDYDSATFQKLLTDNNIKLRFKSSRDNFGGVLYMLRDDSDLGFKLLQLALTAPRFDEEPVERMRAANLSRIRSSMADPDWKAARLMNDTAFAGHPYALNTGGTLTTLQNISPADLHEFVKTRLGRDNLHVAVTGDITPDELASVLDNVFGGLPASATLPAVADMAVQGGGETILYEEDIPQTIIEIMQPGIGRQHPDYYTGLVMNFILGSSGFGSRLTEVIREKRGLTYGISTYFYDLQHIQGLAASTSTKNESAAEVLALIKQEWRRMREEPVSDSELASAKSYLIGSFPLSLVSSDQISSILVGLQLDGLSPDYLAERAERINAVTKEDVQRLAQELLTPDNLTTVLVGQPEGVTPTRTVDILPNVE